jgi:hypothetical protein
VSTPDENFLWWSRGAADGIEAAITSAQAAFAIVAETYDRGDPERARMLISVYQGLLLPERLRRGPDGRIQALDLFIDQQYIETIRQAAQGQPGSAPDAPAG